jgi:hypothetical protein
VGSCECCNEPSGYIKVGGGAFLDKLRRTLLHGVSQSIQDTHMVLKLFSKDSAL